MEQKWQNRNEQKMLSTSNCNPMLDVPDSDDSDFKMADDPDDIDEKNSISYEPSVLNYHQQDLNELLNGPSYQDSQNQQ